MLGVPRFRGVAIVDQHRDMRLDVDRMSYEVSAIVGYFIFACLIFSANLPFNIKYLSRSFLHWGSELAM